MAIPILISLLIISATIFIHGLGTTWLINHLLRTFNLHSTVHGPRKNMFILSHTAVLLMLLHFIEIVLWAMVFLLIPSIDNLTTWEEAIYFSMVTYATLGYGDITLPEFWRVMSGFEAMNGILLFGWSTALFFAVVQKIVSRGNQK
jgi:voltage-gated potassium channel